MGLYLTPLAMKAARELGLMAKPDGQLRTQAAPVAYLGGVAVYLAFLLALAVSVEFSPRLMGLLLGTTIVLMVGLVDDFGVMTPRMKLFGQVIAALALIKGGVVIELTIISEWRWPLDLPLLAWALSALWLIGIANALNFLDIEDGLAGGVAASCCPALIAVALLNGRHEVAVFTAALLGADLGFLRYNLPLPGARIYLGDAGSLFLGVSLAALAMIGSYTDKNNLGAFGPLLILGVPCFEMALTMTARLLKGLPVWRGSPDHIAKRLKARGWSPKNILALHYGASLGLGGLAIFIMNTGLHQAAMALGVLAAITLIVFVILLRIPTGKPAEERKPDEA